MSAFQTCWSLGRRTECWHV